MKVAMLVLNPCVNDARVIKAAEALNKGGHEVVIYCVAKTGLKQTESVNGVRIIRVNLLPTFLRRGSAINTKRSYFAKEGESKSVFRTLKLKLGLAAKREIGFFIKFWVLLPAVQGAICKFKPDVIHCHDLNTLLTGYFLSRFVGSQLVYDAHEMEQYRNPPLSSLQRTYVKLLERFFGRRATAVITVSEPISKFLKSELKTDEVTLIYNAPVYNQESSIVTIRDAVGGWDGALMVYVGGILVNRGVEVLIKSLVVNESFHLALVGAISEDIRIDLEQLSERLDVARRVHFVEPVPPKEVVAFIRSADVGVFAISGIALSYEYCMPNKLFEMSFAGLPLAVSDLTAVRQFVNEVGNGALFDPSCVEQVASVIDHVYKNSDHFRAREGTLNKYAWNTQTTKLIRLYNRIEASILEVE
jgi:glycosyltransferase involved in cell wall biosynthesis